MSTRLIKILLSTVLVSFFFLSNSQAQEEKYITLYVYNFTKYIEWPDEYKGGDFVIDVLGHTSVYEKLNKMLKDKSRSGQQFVVNDPSGIEEIDSNCHILFIGHWQSNKLEQALKKVGNQGTLVITEKGGMLNQGSNINLVINQNKIMYEVKKSSLEKSGLSYSIDLTSLAHRVLD